MAEPPPSRLPEAWNRRPTRILGTAILEPRLWPRDADGIPTPEDPTLPVVGVSWNDAMAYLAWKATRIELPAGTELSLPNAHEWVTAFTGGGEIHYVFGDEFWPGWVGSHFSHRVRRLEPAFRYPIDESCYGVFDLSGGVREWAEIAAWESGGPERANFGGSWMDTLPAEFQVLSRHGRRRSHCEPMTGFRLVIVPVESRQF